MKEVTAGVYLLRGVPPAGFNVYLIRSGERWVLVDTATRHARRRILRQLPGELEAILITHAHVDHAGSMHAVAEATGAPVWAPETDADAIEGKADVPLPEQHRNHPANRIFAGWWRDHHRVAKRLTPGDLVAGFEVVDFPGHTPGQIGLWRGSDRTVLCADVMRSMSFYTGLPQLGEMPSHFTCDVPQARRSIQKLAALEPETVLFGHGRPMAKNTPARLAEFAAKVANSS
jgi:glyoxylase-like metal-dependent hydrolase (beta-lactamase superfamily II)